MSLYWLAYRQDRVSCVLIVEAPEPLTARLRAEAQVPGINARFSESHELDHRRAALVPPGIVGRLLDADEAERLLTRLKILAVKKPPARSVPRRGSVRQLRAG